MDSIDRAQQRQQEEIDQALAARKRDRAGRTTCAECGDAISELRTRLGAELCMPCQRAIEAGTNPCARRGA